MLCICSGVGAEPYLGLLSAQIWWKKDVVKEERAYAERGLKPGRSAHRLLGQCSHQGKRRGWGRCWGSVHRPCVWASVTVGWLGTSAEPRFNQVIWVSRERGGSWGFHWSVEPGLKCFCRAGRMRITTWRNQDNALCWMWLCLGAHMFTKCVRCVGMPKPVYSRVKNGRCLCSNLCCAV